MAEQVKNTEVTEEQIRQWKEKYGKVYRLTAEDGSVGYIRKPNRKDLRHAHAISAGDPVKFNETILRDCWLGGDKSVIEDDDKFFGVAEHLDKIIETAQVELEEL